MNCGQRRELSAHATLSCEENQNEDVGLSISLSDEIIDRGSVTRTEEP